jgi:transcriptional regulator with XRE-family HTH domain
MKKTDIVSLLKRSKESKNYTIHDIAHLSGVSVRTVNRIFAGEDVRCSSLVAVLTVLDLEMSIFPTKKVHHA